MGLASRTGGFAKACVNSVRHSVFTTADGELYPEIAAMTAAD